MRLHLLEITAIGPFATKQVIDFDELAASGLFLLDGPTGAGKTTVLDAITFALYGPGERGGDGRLHSDFAAPGTEPTVHMEFSLRGVRHRITRSPEYERPKRRGDGTTIQAAQAHLERLEDGAWVSRSSNKAEVADMLADEIGLTREQFTQVVLLPQGEFARFLRSSDDERRTLLTKLFGTQLYDRITDELDRRRQSEAKELEAAAQRVRSSVSAAAEAAGLDADERAELCGLPAAERGPRLAALGSVLTSRHETAKAVAVAAAADRAAAVARANDATAALERIDRFARIVAARDAHELDRVAHDEALRVLSDARRAEPVAPLLGALAEAAATVDTARNALLEIEPEPSDEHLAGGGHVGLAERGARLSRQAAELQHLVDHEQTLPHLAAARDAAVADLDEAARTERSLAARLAELPATIEGSERAVRTSQERAAALGPAETRHTAAERRLGAAERLVELTPLLAAARGAAARAVDEHQRTVDEHQRCVDARLAGLAAELAGQLVDGAPCAVCGSVEHPQAARPAAGAVTAAQVDAADKARRKAETVRRRADRAVAELEREHDACAAIADGVGVEALRSELAESGAVIAEGRAAKQQLPALVAVHERLVDEQAKLAGQLTLAVVRRSTADAAAQSAQRALDELARELSAAADGHPSVAARQAELAAGVVQLDALADAVRGLGAAVEAHRAAVERATREAQAREFGTLEESRGALVEPAMQTDLQRLVETWRGEAQRLAAAADADEFHGLDPAAADATRAVAARARDDLAGVERHAEHAIADAERARHSAERFAACLAEIDGAVSEYSALAAHAEPVLYLAKLTKGMSGQRRVALTTYVLRHWFEQVVQAANTRLSSISSGRYELVRVDEGVSRAERTGLTLQVIDRHTGESRSTRSLSGGETFYTSLALALGLADVVKAQAGGADLDTLFIDEGFGSLDADTLEQVMAVIEDLRERGRIVGIVSHLTDLKDRISERVEVHRLSDGSSALRVVA